MKMRHAMRLSPFLLAMFVLDAAALPALADTLPAYCGAVGAKSYTPPAVTIPAVVLNRGTVITVTNATVAVNGDTSSVAALMASPGADGISLPEAVIATNNNPGTWVIQFAPALKGSTIHLDPAPSLGFLGLFGLTGGNVTINGDIDGDGKPDITLTTSQSGNTEGISVASGGNTLNGLALQNFTWGVWISAPGPGQPGASGGTFSNITISNMVMTNIQNAGIYFSPADASGTWDHLLIAGNTFSGSVSGPINAIDIELSSTAGDTLQHTTIANNNITIPMPGAGGIVVGAGSGLGARNNQALDTLIANNVITGALPQFGIRIATGVGSASSNLIDGVQVIANQLEVTGPAVLGEGAPSGIIVVSGDAASDFQFPSLLPIQYSENNILRNLSILSNTFAGPFGFGIYGQAACCGNADNTIANLSILGNTMTGLTTVGVLLTGGASGYPSRPTTGNTLSNVLIQANSIQMTPPDCNCYPLGIDFGGIQVWAGWGEPGNSVNGISVSNNDVDTPLVGIGIIAGLGDNSPPDAPVSPANNNVVSAAQIYCNQVDQVPTLAVEFPGSQFLGTQGIDVTAGVLNASGNQVEQLTVVDNLVAGVLGGAALFANLRSTSLFGNQGTPTGNTISISQISSSVDGPAITGVQNAESYAPLIAPNTWIAITGTNLAADPRSWMLPDFVNNQLPVALDGTSVTINGQNAYVFYISSTQVNVLTPPSLVSGPAKVQVTLAGISSAPFTVQAQQLSPSFFVIGGSPYVLATHALGELIGPPALFPGSTTPAKPGETIVAYANGFGPASVAVVAGSETQSGVLNPLPMIQVGGITANVRFAGLISPGLYQFNFDIPSGLAAGDYPLLATLSGSATQSGALITVQP